MKLAHIKPTSNKIGIICDLSLSSGLGHFKRMNYLVFELKKLGQKCFFLFNHKDKKLIKKFIENQNVIFFSDEKNKSFQNIKLLIQKIGISTIILDSYKIGYEFENKLVKLGIFVVSIDDHLRKHAANIIVSNRSCIQKLNKKNQIWLIGLKYILIPKLKKKLEKKIKKKLPLKILLHAGGLSFYNLNKTFTESAIKASSIHQTNISILCSTFRSIKFIHELSKKYKMASKIKILPYSKNFLNSISNYDVVAGPAGTTTFEAILAGVLPFSMPIKKDGRDSLNSWNSIGHMMHLTDKEKKNKKLLDSSWDLIIKNYSELLNNLRKNSKSIDGFGAKRLAKKIILISKKKKIKLFKPQKKIITNKLVSNMCKIHEARSFLEARNQKQVRLLSSKPNHIIIWPEHIRWWLKKEILKYSVKKDNLPLAYHWTKVVVDKKGKFIISGWFLSGDPDDKLRIASEVLKFQYKSVKKQYNNLTWIITMREENKFVERLNKRIGFKKASHISIKRASKMFFNSKIKFKCMEMII